MKIKSSNLVFGGISTALIIIFLYIGAFIVTNKVFFMAISIAIGSVSYIKGGIKAGITLYLASSVLAFFLVPNKLYIGIYIIFGLYPLIKLIAEKYNTIAEYLLKYIAFNVLAIIAYFIYSNLIYLGPLFDKIYFVVAFVIFLQIAFFIFDFAFTKFIMFVEDRILKRI